MQAVYYSAITDGLTGLYNRRYFLDRVSGYVKRKAKVAVVFCDIDNFKRLNDTHGHQKGDEVLKQVSKIIKEESEDVGIAGRYGGEELVVLLTDSSVLPNEFTESIRKRVEEETIVTISVGYSLSAKDLSADDLIHQSDHAMYNSKQTGKNKVSRYITNLM